MPMRQIFNRICGLIDHHAADNNVLLVSYKPVTLCVWDNAFLSQDHSCHQRQRSFSRQQRDRPGGLLLDRLYSLHF